MSIRSLKMATAALSVLVAAAGCSAGAGAGDRPRPSWSPDALPLGPLSPAPASSSRQVEARALALAQCVKAGDQWTRDYEADASALIASWQGREPDYWPMLAQAGDLDRQYAAREDAAFAALEPAYGSGWTQDYRSAAGACQTHFVGDQWSRMSRALPTAPPR